MSPIKTLFLALIFAGVSVAGVPDDDKKWAATVKEMIAAGPATISTPSEKRLEIAKQLAVQAGRKADVSKSAAGYRIHVH